MVSIACTVFFEDPFWVGVWERTDGRMFCAAKATFGAQPSEKEVWVFVLERYGELAFSKPESGYAARKAACNPKRTQREASCAVSATGAGTKAQSREDRRAEEERKFLLRQEKKKARHKGR